MDKTRRKQKHRGENTDPGSAAGRWARRILYSIIAVAPWLLGSVHDWAVSLLLLMAMLAMLFSVSDYYAGATHLRVPKLPLLLLLGLAAIAAVQLIPLSDVVPTSTTMAHRVELERARIPPAKIGKPAETELRSAFSADRTFPISMEPDRTQTALKKYAFFALVLVVTALSTGRREHLFKLTLVIALTGGAVAVFGLMQNLFWNGKILGVIPISSGSQPYGPFINRNHFGGYIAMTLPLCICVLVRCVVFRDKRRRALLILGTGLSALAMMTASIASNSRGAVVSTGIGLVFLCLLLARPRSTRFPALGFLSVAAVLLVYLVTLDGGRGFGQLVRGEDRALGRFETVSDDLDTRAGIWRSGIAIFQEDLPTGVGFGAFRSAYNSHKPADSPSGAVHAESDYITLAAEGGIGAVILAGGLLVCLLWRMQGILRTGLSAPLSIPREVDWWMFDSAAIAALTALLVHGVFDVNLHVPATALLFVSLATLVMRSPMRSREPASGFVSAAAILPLLAGIVIALPFIARTGGGDFYRELARRGSFRDVSPERLIPWLERAIALDDANAAAHLHLGKLLASRTRNASSGSEDTARAYRHLARAMRLRPLRSEAPFHLGWMAAFQGLQQAPPNPAFATYGERLVEQAVALNPGQYAYKIRLGYYQTMVSPGGYHRGVVTLREAIEERSGVMPEVLNLLDDFLPQFMVRKVVPDKSSFRFMYGRHLATTGHCNAAIEQFQRAVELARVEPSAPPNLLPAVASYLVLLGQSDSANPVWQESLAIAPRDPELLLGLAESLRMVGRRDEARDCTREAHGLLRRVEPRKREKLQAKLAWNASLLGDCEIVLQLVNTTTTEPKALHALGSCLVARGELTRATRIFKRALSLNSDDALSKAYLQRIESQLATAFQ